MERASALEKLVPDAIARRATELTVTLTAILNERVTLSMPTSLKVKSGATGISAMPPFDWTRDKAIYQQWQLWSEKARHALDAMEGDSEKVKISYFHHLIDSDGMAQIEFWKNNGTPLKQEDYDKLEGTQKEGK